MDTTTSREEFEKWAAKNGYRMDLIPDGDIFHIHRRTVHGRHGKHPEKALW